MSRTITIALSSLRQFAGNRLAVVGGALVALVFIVALFASFLSPHDPSAIDIKNILIGPTFAHPSAPTSSGGTCFRA